MVVNLATSEYNFVGICCYCISYPSTLAHWFKACGISRPRTHGLTLFFFRFNPVAASATPAQTRASDGH